MEYKFPLRKEQVKLAQDLFNQIEAKGDLQASIHKFSLSLFSTPPISKDINRWKCPLLCYLAVDNLRDDGNFKEAHHLTSILAHWEYIIRGVCLYEAKETASTYENGIIGYFYYESSLFRSSLICFARSVDSCHTLLLKEDRICPYNSVRELQQFASSLAMGRVSPPAITWTTDYS